MSATPFHKKPSAFIPPMKVSVNQLKTWSRCRKKYEYDHVHQLRWPTDPSNFQLGQNVHKLLDYQSRQLDCSLLLQNTDEKVQRCWDILMTSRWPHLPIVANEWGFTVPVNLLDISHGDVSVIPRPEDSLRNPFYSNPWLVGRIDRIAWDGKTLVVIDWKTGTGVPKLPQEDWQTLVYLFATVEASSQLGIQNLSPEQVQFAYIEVKEQVREVIIPYSKEEHEKTRQRIQETLIAMAAERHFDLPAQCPDRYCPYPSICGIQTQETEDIVLKE